MREYYWTGQRMKLNGWREGVYGEVGEEGSVAIEEKGIWKGGMGTCIVGRCEVGFGSDVIEAGSDGKTERRRECGYQYVPVVEVEKKIV